MWVKETNLPVFPIETPSSLDSSQGHAGSASIAIRWLKTAALLRAAISASNDDKPATPGGINDLAKSAGGSELFAIT